MKKLYGNTIGLKANHIRRLENLYRRRVPVEYLISQELARDMGRLSAEIGRQIGVLIDRSGRIIHIVVGDGNQIVIPDISDYRTTPGRLNGLRCVHTHLAGEALTRDDITDLALLRLDMMAAITLDGDGLPKAAHIGHILPKGTGEEPCALLPPVRPHELNIGCRELIRALEAELSQIRALYESDTGKERAFLVSITTAPRRIAADSLAELRDLAMSAGINVIETVLQQRKSVDSRFLMGSGKLQDLTIAALQKGATLIIFDQELNASQIRSIGDRIDLKVIDRTQLILDIFAQRAHTRESKLQVELAQLKYLLPRLVVKNTAMSRLTGGIGGRGPGETKLEINRRRARDRIKRLTDNLSLVNKQREQRKAKRDKKGLPIISIVGYTNAGKSTLLNTLTKSDVLAESRLFATLNPASRRLRFPKDMEVIITDTVGFIKDLPKDLMAAFRSTLEELESADLLLHVIDMNNPRFREQIESVERIIGELELDTIPMVRVLNKRDLLDPVTVEHLCTAFNATAISAKNKASLAPLIKQMQSVLEDRTGHSGNRIL